MKDPKITVFATEQLLAELVLAQQALKASRAPGTKHVPELHSLIVQLMVVRSRMEPLLTPPPG